LLAGGNFLWLTRRAGRIGRGIATTSSGAGWAVASGLRLLAIGVVCVVLLKLEVVHPVGLVAGLTVLPGMIIVEGLRAAREDG
jgi:hypothetical protein